MLLWITERNNYLRLVLTFVSDIQEIQAVNSGSQRPNGNDKERKLGHLRCISHSFTFIFRSILKQQGWPKYSPNTGHRAQRQCSKCVFSQSLFFPPYTHTHTHTKDSKWFSDPLMNSLSDVAREKNAVVSEHVVWNTSLPSCCFSLLLAAFSRSLPPVFS